MCSARKFFGSMTLVWVRRRPEGTRRRRAAARGRPGRISKRRGSFAERKGAADAVLAASWRGEALVRLQSSLYAVHVVALLHGRGRITSEIQRGTAQTSRPPISFKMDYPKIIFRKPPDCLGNETVSKRTLSSGRIRPHVRLRGLVFVPRRRRRRFQTNARRCRRQWREARLFLPVASL
jgi:hypothetical protein